MWAYRVAYPYDIEPTISLEAAAQSFNFNRTITFSKAMSLALDLCKHIDWDGTFRDQVGVWAVPGLKEMSLGFVFRDVQGRTFIVSPISLPHMAKTLDWDAMVSHEEIANAKRAIRTGEVEPPRATLTQDWQVSRKGNLFAKINGAAVTVFMVDNGFKAILNPIDREPITTRVFPLQQECCDYVLNHWYEIINPPDPSDTEDPADW